VRVAICIITYRRPRWLTECLRSLAQLTMGSDAEVCIVVVDNDAEGAGRGLVADAQAWCPFPLVYEIEAERGISFARNRAVHVAMARAADFVAFLDDDEMADRDWLDRLVAAQRRYGADVVAGPVLPSYEPGVPKWAIQGRFFERPRHPTGTRLAATRSGNCLINARLFAGETTPFDPKFALSGGSDTHFFKRMHRDGASIVWADDAIVREHVPASRATVRWVLQRAYRGGACFAVSERMDHRSRAWISIRLFTGAARSILGLLLLLPSLVLGKAGAVRALQFAFVGVGLLSGFWGVLYREYSVVHGE